MKRRFVALVAAAGLAGLGAFVAPAQAGSATPRGIALESHQLRGINLGGKVDKGRPGGGTAQVTVNCGVPTCFKYALAEQSSITGSDGAQIDMKVSKPALLTFDHHSLGDLALNDGSGNVVEAGFNVDPTTNGDSNPHLFVFKWVNGTAGTYNGNFSLAVGRPISPGDSLLGLIGSNITLKWQHFGAGCGCTTGWWLSYGGSFVGVFPDTLWTSPTFTAESQVQAFGELSLGYDPSASDIGTGSLLAANQATMGGYALTGTSPPTAAFGSFANTPSSVSDRWPITSTSSTSFRYGGPGGNETKVGGPTSPTNDCPGVGTGSDPTGQGSFCTYNGLSGGVPQTKVTQLDGGASALTCRPNQGKLDGGGLAAINYLHLGLYRKVNWFRDASCAGAAQIYGYGTVTLPAGWNNLDHASFSIRTDRPSCATGYPTIPPTC